MLDIETAKELLGGALLRPCLMGALAFLVAGALCYLWKFCRKRLGGLWLRSRSQFVALMIAAGIATGVAQKSTNNVPPNMNSPLPQMMQGGGSFQLGLTGLSGVGNLVNPVNPVQNHIPGQVTSEDIVRGYRIESVTTNSEPFAAMPSNAVEYAQWSLRGGRETWFPLEFGGFEFPLGMNRIRRLRVLSGGMVETVSPNEPAAICAAREYASLIPGYSRFQWADSDDGVEKTLRWEGVYANRDRTGEYDAEIKFFANGDFTMRSNEVETVCRRVNPDDWDGDGLANVRDADPMVCDGYFYGVANALPTNANPDAYYWLDLSVTGLLGVATVRVTCDGPSDLGDHLIIAQTNQVCHIPLLAGATYTVDTDLPIDYSAVSIEYAEIVTNTENNLIVSLPLELTFERVQMRGGSDSYIAHTSPVDVGPRILDIAGGCCSCTTNEAGFSWSCGTGCNCGGFWHDISTVVAWEGYSHSFVWRGWCPCHQNTGSDAPVAMLAFTPQVVFFENAFTNAYCQPVNSRSTLTRLVGAVYGGEYGGTYSIVVNDGGKLVRVGESYSCAVTNVEPYAYHDFWIDYRATKKSDSPDDIVATLTFSPAADATQVSTSARATAIEVSTYADCHWIPHCNRKELGVGERVTIGVQPTEEEMPIDISGCCYTNLQWRYTASASARTDTITASCNGVVFPICFTIVEPESIVATSVWCETNEYPGVAGNFVGYFDVAVLPTNVSFQAILTAELGYSATNAVGFFALPEHVGLLDHSAHGANNWHGVGRGNSFSDTVAFKYFHPPWGNGGSFTWPIENAWRVRSDGSVTNRMPWRSSYDQRFELDADGTTRIRKFDYVLQQGTNLEFQVMEETR